MRHESLLKIHALFLCSMLHNGATQHQNNPLKSMTYCDILSPWLKYSLMVTSHPPPLIFSARSMVSFQTCWSSSYIYPCNESHIAFPQLSISISLLSLGCKIMDSSTGWPPNPCKPVQASATAFLNSIPRFEMYRRWPDAIQYALTLGGYGRLRVITYIQLSVMEIVLIHYIGNLWKMDW